MSLDQESIEQAKQRVLVEKIAELNTTLQAENFMKAKEYIDVKRLLQTIREFSVDCQLAPDLASTIIELIESADDFITECIKAGKSLSELTVVSLKEIPTELTHLAMKKIKIEGLYDDVMDAFSSTD